MYICIWIGGDVDINVKKKKKYTSSSEVYDEDDQSKRKVCAWPYFTQCLARPLSKGRTDISITMTLTPAQPQNQKITCVV